MIKIKPLILALLLMASPAVAQDSLLEWAKNHSSVVSGVASANGERTEFVSLALDVDFEVQPRVRAFGNLTLFGRQRVSGESVADPDVPLTLDALALYSAGEATGGVYFEAWEKVGFECRGGVMFEMSAFTGKVGDPVDGSKFLGACGLRLTGPPGRLSILAGHYGPVLEGARFYGFLPSTIISGDFRLTDSTRFLVDIAAGRDLTTSKAVTISRFAVKKAFR